MAAGRETISLSFQADLGDLKKQLAQLDGVTKKEAAQMVKDLNTGFKQAERAAQRASKANKKQFQSMAQSAQMATQAITQAAAAVVALSQEFADLQNELADASARTGVAVDTLAGLRLAAEGSGLQFAKLEAGLGKLPKAMADAARGAGPAARAFEKLGIEVVDVEGNLRSSDEVLRETFDALRLIDNQAEKAATTMELFGLKAGPAFIQSGAIDNLQAYVDLATTFGVDIGPKAAQQAADFQRAMALFDMAYIGSLQRLVGSIGGPDGVNAAINGATTAIVFMGEVFSGILAELSEQIGRYIDGPVRAMAMAIRGEPIEALKIFKETYTTTIDGLLKLGSGSFLVTGLFDGVDRALDKVAELQKKQEAVAQAPAIRAAGLVADEAPAARGKPKKAGKTAAEIAAEKAIKDLEKLRQAQKKASEARLSERAKIELAYLREIEIIQAAHEADADAEELRAATAITDRERMIALAELDEKLHAEKMKRIEAEAEAAKRLNEQTVTSTQDALASLSTLAGAAATAMSQAGTEGARQNALLLFGVQKALALSLIPIKLAEGLMTAAAQPPPINTLQAATVLATAAAQGISIASAKPPTFDRGGIINAGTGDQIAAAVLPGEAILSREAVANIGPGGVDALNSGRGMGGPMVVQMVYRHRVFDEFVSDNIQAPTPLGSALRGDRVTGRRS